MAETMRDSRGWNWVDIIHDLKTQGEIEEVIINPLAVKPGSCEGTYKEKKFLLTWKPNHYFLLSMAQDNDSLQKLVGAFSKVIEYSPFCKYRDGEIFTYEWDRVNPDERYVEISKQDVTDLVKI